MIELDSRTGNIHSVPGSQLLNGDAGRVRSLLSDYDASGSDCQRAGVGVGDSGSRTGNTAATDTFRGSGSGVDAVAGFESQSSGMAAPTGGLLLDYLRCTVPATAANWAAIGAHLGTLTPRDGGWHSHYGKTAAVLVGGIVAWASYQPADVDGTILIDLPGAAVAAVPDLLPFLEWCCSAGHVGRADWAIDDRTGRLTFERLNGSVDAGAVVTTARGLQWVINRDAVNGGRDGFTLYAGSRNSDCLFRIYDKAAERLARAGVQVDGHWVRCEMQTSSKLADTLMRAVLSDGLGAVMGELNRRLRFCEPSADSNRSRWPLAEWWTAFLGSVERGRRLAAGEPLAVTADGLMEYIRRQTGKAIYTVMRLRGGDMTWLDDIAADGGERLDSKYRALLAAAGVTV